MNQVEVNWWLEREQKGTRSHINHAWMTTARQHPEQQRKLAIRTNQKRNGWTCNGARMICDRIKLKFMQKPLRCSCREKNDLEREKEGGGGASENHRKTNYVKCHDRLNHFRPYGSIDGASNFPCRVPTMRWYVLIDRYCEITIIQFRWKMSYACTIST